jgi:hypothetical protein
MSATVKFSNPPSAYSEEGEDTLRPGFGSRSKTDTGTVRPAKSTGPKAGQRGTIYWVGKAIIGEDGRETGERSKGASYRGEWLNNGKHGYGVQVYPNGQKYEGQWENGFRNGEGTLWMPVGKAQKLRKLYVGGWQDDKRHGRGTCFFNNGEFYQGSWDQGKMHGQGTLRYGNGDLYIGEWHQGLRSGQGTLNKANGDCYEGYWLNDKREGSGSFFYSESGKVFVGEWANDLPKAGVYTQANPNPEQTTQIPVTSVLPSLELAFPAQVLESALMVVRNNRKTFRAKNTPIERLFADDEIAALREAFASVQQADGTVGADHLQQLCSHLGISIASPMGVVKFQGLLKDLGFLRSDTTMMAGSGGQAFSADTPMALTFEDFLRVIALLLDEEAVANPDSSLAEQNLDEPTFYSDEPTEGL